MKLYAAIICDIISSRAIADRDSAQQTIDTAFDTTNKDFKQSLAVPLQFTLGDEFQCLLHDYIKAPALVSKIREEVAPVGLRIAIGIGEILTEVSNDIRRVDGQAFHAARDAMDIMLHKKRDRDFDFVKNSRLKSSMMLTRLRTQSGRDEIVDTIYMLYDSIISERTDKQWLAIKAYHDAGSFGKAAEILGTSFQNVSKMTHSAKLYETDQTDKFLEKYLLDTYSENR